MDGYVWGRGIFLNFCIKTKEKRREEKHRVKIPTEDQNDSKSKHSAGKRKMNALGSIRISPYLTIFIFISIGWITP